MQVGWGILGAGAHSERAIAAAMAQEPTTRLVCIADTDVERARRLSQQYGVTRTCASLEAMLNDPEVEAVYIGTPNHLHAPQTIMAAEAGKHVLCEKPMALNVADAERMIAACEKHRVKLGIDFQNRYHPAHVEARRLIQANKVGDISVTRIQYCHGQGLGYWQGWRSTPQAS